MIRATLYFWGFIALMVVWLVAAIILAVRFILAGH